MTWKLNPHGLILPADFADSGTPARPERDEIASTLDGRDITRGMVDAMRLELPDDTVLMQRGGGDYSLYREVLRDDHVKAALQQRIDSVIGRPIEVRPGGDKRIDKQAAAFLQEQIEELGWDAITQKMLYGVFYGYAVGEAMWGADGSRVTLDNIKVRDRRRFGFDGAGRLRLKTMSQPNGELLPERKFWHFACGADHDDAPYGLGLAHWLYWPVWLKRNGLRFWAVFLEKFGTPTAVGQFPPGTSPGDQAKLLAALRAIQRDSAIIFPEGMKAELLEATRSGSADHAAFVSMMNAAILVITIGQTASTQGTPGKLGNDQEQADVRADITKADADLVCMSFNGSIARWLTEWNFPGAAFPQVWRVMDEPEDTALAAERDSKLVTVGFKPTLERVTKVYGEGYEAVATNPDPSGFQNLTGLPADAPEFAAPEDTPDAPDTLATQATRLSSDTAPIMADLIAGIGKMVESATSIEALQTDLVNAYGHLDTDELTRIMALAFAAAELAGMYEARQ